jgi:hypothetical protein
MTYWWCGCAWQIFGLFSTKAAWTAKELVRETGQKESQVKNVLKEVADYENSGPNRNKSVQSQPRRSRSPHGGLT